LVSIGGSVFTTNRLVFVAAMTVKLAQPAQTSLTETAVLVLIALIVAFASGTAVGIRNKPGVTDRLSTEFGEGALGLFGTVFFALEVNQVAPRRRILARRDHKKVGSGLEWTNPHARIKRPTCIVRHLDYRAPDTICLLRSVHKKNWITGATQSFESDADAGTFGGSVAIPLKLACLELPLVLGVIAV